MVDRRIFLIVLDSYGIGELPDAADFGDEGSNTLRSITKSPEYDTPLMKKMGLFNIDGVDYAQGVEKPIGSFGRLAEVSKGRIPPLAIGKLRVLCPRNHFQPTRMDFLRICWRNIPA